MFSEIPAIPPVWVKVSWLIASGTSGGAFGVRACVGITSVPGFGTPTVAASVLSAPSDTFAGGLVGGAAVGGMGVAVGAGALLHAARMNRHRIAVNRTDRITTSLKSRRAARGSSLS